jgi:hypothetical protein
MSDFEKWRKIEDNLDDERERAHAVEHLLKALIDEDPPDLPDDRIMGNVEAAARTVDHIRELERELAEMRRIIDGHAEQLERFDDIGAEKSSKEAKIAQIVQFADNQRSTDQDAVTVLPKSIKGVVGVSRRYAYDLVDDLVVEFDWALDPQEQPRRVDQDTPQRGVIIDFERLHEDHGSVNKFTTRITEQEAST